MNVKNLSFILFICFASCKKQANDYEMKIIGDWSLVEEIPKREDNYRESLGYSFNPNGTIEFKPGYFHRDQKTDDRVMLFYGNNSQFKIEEDSLAILNLMTKKWDKAKIMSLASDTLKLQFHPDRTLIFLKRHYKLKDENSFDKVIVSNAPCYGPCPINNTLVENNGTVTYLGEHYNSVNGYYEFKINPEELKQIAFNFKKADFMNLDNIYSLNASHQTTVTTTFVRNDSIIKTIHDYADQAPSELRWASKPVSFLYQTQKLKAFKPHDFLDFKWCNAIKGNQIAELEQSENFYLMYLLNKSKIVKKSFVGSYKIVCHSEKVNNVTSDGRHFKFEMNDGEEIILDIGFDFFERNAKHIEFKKMSLEQIKNYS